MSELSKDKNTTPVVAVDILEELTEQEAAERHRLELRVERAFCQAGVALRELRDRKLYRSTHRTFEEYCRQRFGFERRHPYRLIDAAVVIENLEEFCVQFGHILPAKESVCRPLTALTPDEQRQVWHEALEETDGRHPTGPLIRGIVERLKEKHTPLATDSYNVGEAFWVTGLSGSERQHNCCWALARSVNDFTLEIDVHDAVLLVKPDNLKPIDETDACRQLPTILKRIRRLRESGLLDRGAYNVLEDLGRHTYLTEVEEGLLSWLENHYGVN